MTPEEQAAETLPAPALESWREEHLREVREEIADELRAEREQAWREGTS
jgi:hypothetical protein